MSATFKNNNFDDFDINLPHEASVAPKAIVIPETATARVSDEPKEPPAGNPSVKRSAGRPKKSEQAQSAKGKSIDKDAETEVISLRLPIEWLNELFDRNLVKCMKTRETPSRQSEIKELIRIYLNK